MHKYYPPKLTTQQHILWIVSSLIATCVRYEVQYRYPPWHQGFFHFVAVWAIHAVCLGLLSAFVTALSFKFLPAIENDSMDERLKQTLVLVSLTLIVISVFIFLGLHGVQFGSDDYE